MSRYGTLVNKQDLKGGEEELKEGDHLQFGHKSSFRYSSCTVRNMKLPTLTLVHAADVKKILGRSFGVADFVDGSAASQLCRTLQQFCNTCRSLVSLWWLSSCLQQGCLYDFYEVLDVIFCVARNGQVPNLQAHDCVCCRLHSEGRRICIMHSDSRQSPLDGRPSLYIRSSQAICH